MKLAIFSDLHLHPFSAFDRLSESGLSTRLTDVSRVAQEILKGAERTACDWVLFAGDFFHVRNVPAEAYDLASGFIAMARELSLKIAFIPGNHDIVDDGASYHAVRIFRETGCILLSEYAAISEIDGLRIQGMAYHPKAEAIYAGLEKGGADIVVLHAPLRGAALAGDMVAPPAEDILLVEKVREAAGNPKLIVAGHYHSPQLLRTEWEKPKPKITYTDAVALVPGAPMQHSFGDAGEERGWWKYDSDDHQLTFFPIKSPKFMKLTYGAFLKDPEVIEGNYVEIEVPPSVPEVELKEVKEAASGSGAVIHWRRGQKVVSEKAPRSSIVPSMGPMEALRTYAKMDPPEHPKLTLKIAEEVWKSSEERNG